MTQNEESEDENSILPFIITSLTDDRGQTKFCQNLIANLFERGVCPCAADFREVKIKRQIVDHYLKGTCNLTQQYGIYTIEIMTPSKFHGRYRQRRYRILKSIHRIHKKYTTPKFKKSKFNIY